MNVKRLALPAVLALAVAGCGGGDETAADEFEGEEAEVAAVVDRLGEAARAGDVKTICEDLVTVALQRSVREAAGTSCGQEFEENVVADDAEFTVDSIEVSGDEATAIVTDQDDRKSTLFLGVEEGEWRIARIGDA